MSKLKEQNAEFAVVQGIDHKPAFVLKKRDRIVASMRKWQTRYLKKSHKFGAGTYPGC